MQSGESVQFGSQHPFDRNPVDQIMEETVNPDTQRAGATKGFGLNGMLWGGTTSLMTHLSHPDRHMLRIISDEADVQFSVKLLEDVWTTFRPK